MGLTPIGAGFYTVRWNAPRMGVGKTTNLDMARGIVKWFNDKKGFGFISGASAAPDIFVHYSVIQGDGHKTLAEAEEVEYELMDGENSSKASCVTRINPPPREQRSRQE